MKLRQEITETLLLVWPLLVGILIVMIGNGLQGTLLSLRAELAGFPVVVTGLVMSMYYCGYVGGWFIVPKMINSVGHIRVFAGFASLASTTILLQGLFVDPFTWGAVRVVSGVSFAGLFIVAESWLNDIATNKLRARIFSAYIFVIHAGMFLGQFLINIAPAQNIGLFILVSILISLALIPITLANKPSPDFDEPEHLDFFKLLSFSQHAVAGVFVAGFTNAGIITMAPVYLKQMDYAIPQISLMLAVFVLGCSLLPLVAGWLSDVIGRRIVIVLVSVIAFLATGLAFVMSELLYLCFFLVGGATTAIYSIGVAMMNDYLKPKQRTSAAASLILLNGMAACLAPIMIGGLMEVFGVRVFFVVFCFIFMILTLFGLYRAKVGDSVSVEDQTDFQSISTRASPAAMQIPEEN